MSQIELKAQKLRDEALKKRSANFFKTLFSKTSDSIEQSIEYYARAANLFKMAKNWSQAGHAFSDAAELSVENDNSPEAAVYSVEAANCFKKCDTTKAVELYLNAISIYKDKGKFCMAAKYHQVIADIFEDEYNIHEALEHYEQAAEYFKQECNHSCANKCLEKIAEYSSLSEDYDKAIGIFQEIACFDLASSVLKYCAKQYFFRAAICLLCTDTDIMKRLQTYINMHPGFEDSREYQLILCLKECLEDEDVKGYENAVRNFDSASHLSQWHVTMLLRAKNRMQCIPDLK
ncbi:hypothetical protein JTB14_014992 [Gonioctena quinquepunctata]|nr:hypothetical protein JTB14_014992 [Gonioctena quinquepunctata]